METERTRRSVDRTREVVVKKPRLAEEAEQRDRASSTRQTPARGSGTSVDPRFRLAERQREEGGNGTAVPYQPHQPQQQLQELIAEYKTALAELTFNSKPIITNLSIIAGENIHAAKAIVATVCAHILEVPSEQKLPVLYLLDSIVKNIGRDYIKYFAVRLPEVFCKAYRQVDPSIHSGMKHLYGTWKGVFPPAPLQSIEKELFATSNNSSSSRSTDSLNPSQTQRPSHSIHVNPKYLEARQRLQQTPHPKVTNNDSRDSSVNSAEDLDRSDRALSSGSVRPWADRSTLVQNIQYPPKEPISQPSRKSSRLVDGNLEFGSDIPEYSDLKVGSTNRTAVMNPSGLDSSMYGTSATGLESSVEKRNGFDFPRGKYKEDRSSEILGQFPRSQSAVQKNKQVSSRSWKNSEEEEYIWDEMSKLPDHSGKTNTWKIENTFEDSQKQANTSMQKRIEPYWKKHDGSLPQSSVEDRLPIAMEFDEKQSQFHNQSGDHLMTRRGGYSDSLYTTESVPGTRKPFSMLHHEPPPASSLNHASVFSRISSQTESDQVPFSSGLPVSLKSSLPNASLIPSSLRISSPSNASLPVTSCQLVTLPLEHQQTQSALQSKQFQMPVLGQVDQNLSSKFSPEVFSVPSSTYIPQNRQAAAPQNSQNMDTFSSSSYGLFNDPKNRVSMQHQSHYEHFLSQEDTKPLHSNELGKSFAIGNSAPQGTSLKQTNPSAEASNNSNAADLLAAIMKSRLVSSNPLSDPCNSILQPPLPGGPLPMQAVLSSIPAIRSSTDSAAISSCNNLLGSEVDRVRAVNPPLPPGPPPPSSLLSHPSTSSVDSNLNPFSSLLSTLVAKGIITSQGSQTSTRDAIVPSSETEIPSQLPPKASNVPASNIDIAISVADSLPAASGNELCITDQILLDKEQSENMKELIGTDQILLDKEQSENMKELIGTEFKPEVIRKLHPVVIDALFDDMRHRCSKCGLRFWHRESLDRHVHLHDSRKIEVANQVSRKWFPCLSDFVSGCLQRSDSSFDDIISEATASDMLGSEPMVSADESQCVCAFCGEPFEDFYCLVSDTWMYKGTVYMAPACEKQKFRRTDGGMGNGVIVHVKCLPESSKDAL